VYEFEAGKRINETLVAAGGLAVEADREWVAQYVNRAERLRDGMKLYIPVAGEEVEAGPAAEVTTANGSEKVSVNQAGQAELEALWGIGPATAEAIINGRPYGTVEELVESKILKQNVWERNRDRLGI
jgi:competence protein ComEA